MLFEYDDIKDPRNMKFTQRKIKGHIILWWKEMKVERRNGKEKTTQ